MTELHLTGRAARNDGVETERLLPPVVLPEPTEEPTGWSPSAWRARPLDTSGGDDDTEG